MDITALFNGKLLWVNSRLENKLFHFELGGRPISSLDHIYEMAITKDYVIITKADRDFRDGRLVVPYDKDEYLTENNIDAYDWDGNHVWNIADLVGPLKWSFFGGRLMTAEIVEKVAGITLPESYATHDFFGANVSGSKYIIDLSDGNKIIAKVGNMK